MISLDIKRSSFTLIMSLQTIAVQHYVFGTTRNILAGAGLCYALQKENYLEIPITLLFPSVYAGYHLFKNKANVEDWLKGFRR